MITAEQLYQEYIIQYTKKKNVGFRLIKDFTKIKQKSCWIYFEKCTQLLNRNENRIDFREYLKSLFDFYGEFVPYNELSTRKSINIYNKYLKQIRKTTPDIKDLHNSLKFVAQYCIDNNLDYDGYIYSDMNMYPLIIKHYAANYTNLIFLACVTEIDALFLNFSKDILDSLHSTLYSEVKEMKMKIRKDTKYKQFQQNMERILNALIEKIKNSNK